ncbi:carbonic anhydrase [Tolypothrix tenuis PCC 7101]|uniref:Carbonic anhydrase n=1 Tax=Tolypothrix tenuis PCC 7101 TaxID=231146 RepID=A0A1Z4N4C4_9CYAN|nr:carbonic anhydrase [Aulosira sp. FACHB-113]BAZ00568.1 carbonic anhydrase [Tolypothrix tenuis PCC 7101]BAZ75511.1 carbonic anhydrase [Aulosira laxa NIES-50]
MKKLIRGLREFQSSYFPANEELFEQLSQGQKPRVLFITCSDSRIDPNLITQAGLGELFVIRNAGNIIPPYGATNGGEGATIEYAIQALDIQQIIICGHSHCGAMKGLMKLDSLRVEMPLVHDWLKYTEATRRLVKDNYSHYKGEELLEIIIAENVLTQIENLRTYPVIRSKLHQKQLSIYAWIYQIETGEVLAYNPQQHAYVLLPNHLPPSAIDETLISPPLTSNGNIDFSKNEQGAVRLPKQLPSSEYEWFPMTELSPEQWERIYRGSKTN